MHKGSAGAAAAAAPFFALERASSLQALTRSLQAFSTLAAAFAASLAGSTLAGAFGIATTRPTEQRDDDEPFGSVNSIGGYGQGEVRTVPQIDRYIDR